MNKFISGAVAALLVAGGIALAAPASATPNHEGVCSDLSTGHIPGAGPSMDISAPEGKLIAEVCVKAGSVNQGNGPEYTPVDPALAEVTITHSSGKDISHYSVRYVDVPVEEEPDPEAVPTQPTAQAGIETCVEGQSVDANGTITLPAFEGGHWAEGEGTLTNVPPGEYGFTPVIHEGYTYDGPEMLFVTVPASVDVECDVPPTTYLPSCTTVTGAQTITGDGVLTVPGGWAEASIAVPFAGDLADIGTVLDIEADPLQYVGLHIDTAEGTIVFEEEPSYGGDLWSNATWEGVEPGLGYAAMGSITEYIEFNGDVDVTGIRLVYTHPEASSTTVESFTIGCTVYTFEPPVIIPEEPEPVVTVTEEEVVDCESNTVTTTTTTTTVGWVYDEQSNTWIEGEPVEEVTTIEREATEEECPVVTPTPTPTPAPVTATAPLTASTADTLAVTGADSLATVGWLTGGALAVAFGALLTVLGIQRRRAHQE